MPNVLAAGCTGDLREDHRVGALGQAGESPAAGPAVQSGEAFGERRHLKPHAKGQKLAQHGRIGFERHIRLA